MKKKNVLLTIGLVGLLTFNIGIVFFNHGLKTKEELHIHHKAYPEQNYKSPSTYDFGSGSGELPSVSNPDFIMFMIREY